MKKIIELKNITKSFDGQVVLDNINLDIYDNEFLTLLGPSGCGKTTTLRLIAGFESPDVGDIIFLGENINNVPPYKRNVNTVFQRYALFPHLNVFENVAFPLREKRVPKAEIEVRSAVPTTCHRGRERFPSSLGWGSRHPTPGWHARNHPRADC